jgi:2-phosphosulfolactate phosphatase
MKTLEVLFSPAEFASLRQRDLSKSVCVVFDILRATSSMITALANGAGAVIPVNDIPEALAIRLRRPEVLLAGERDGLRIGSALTGGIEFDLGNSPREFTRGRVAGRTLVMTTTNGTRALQASSGAGRVLAGSFLNLAAVHRFLAAEQPGQLILICSGTHEEASYEDTLAAGALADLVWSQFSGGHVADSAVMARQIYERSQGDLMGAMRFARNGRRLLAHQDLNGDVAACLQRDSVDLLAELKDGQVRKTA